MSRIRTLSSAFGAALLLALLMAPGASADAFQDIYKDYASSGRIDPCRYTSQQLKDARKQVPGDISQYAPDFPDALDAAAQQRASGGCDKGSNTNTNSAAATTGSTTGTTAGGTTGGTQTFQPQAQTPSGATGIPGAQTPVTPAVTPTPAAVLPDATLAASTDESGDSDTPIPLILLALLGAMAVLAGTAVGAVRYWAFDPPWLGRMRHSVAEAGWRASAAWAEFTDWVRFGR